METSQPEEKWAVKSFCKMAVYSIVAFLFVIWLCDTMMGREFIENNISNYTHGLMITVFLTIGSFILGLIVSLPIAYMRMSCNILSRAAAYVYVYVFRGTPLIAQMFIIYYGLSSFSGVLREAGIWFIFSNALNCALIALSLNTAAYQAEILRGAIMSVPKGQWEGAESLGLSRLCKMRTVILPQALALALRPYGNEFILLMKGSAIASIITIYDLMGMTRLIYSRTFDFQAYIWAAIIYIGIIKVVQQVIEGINNRIVSHLHVGTIS